ncbi:hypothetical protein TRFO_02089 [Tritrichomonas foetus]|uniref:HECT domain-containing protein n=1 Tax=Tritrichomonas foetus TaxID=1144522 RepID=A0A1J4JCL8_9EUKA|nr:hypothetical protein TRFO_02089 [Tritrichomonas foetus]|eukprot:OHS96946.1 hypothetical protein TRFO_02089 [Tritrichomonas foetus]
MGPSPSHAVKPSYLNSNTFASDVESIFEVSPDEQAFCLEFVSTLFERRPEEIVKPFNLPDANTIVDIMTDPFAFTQVTTPTEAWQDVVAPLFSGTDDSKPYIHQLLNAYYKFLKERPNSFMDNEDNRLRLFHEQKQAEIQRLIGIHTKYKNPAIEVNSETLEKLTSAEKILNIIPNNANSIQYHPNYDKITKKMCSLVKDPFSAYVAVRWGFFSGDITSVVVGFNYLVKNLNEHSKIPIHYNFPRYQHIIDNMALENATFIPNNKKISHTKLMSFKMPKISSQSMMSCNGKFIFILGRRSLLTIVTLSKFVNNNEIRFRNYDFKIKKKKCLDTFIATSNGYLVVGGKFIKHEKIYNTQPFSLCEGTVTYEANSFFRSTPKLVAPVACDGTYIYSLIKSKKIAVFTLDSKHIIFHRYIKLRKGTKELLEQFKHLVPKNLDNANFFTNGVFFSFIVLRQADQARFEYFIRNFSLETGCHVNDVTFNLRWPIQSLVFDPWNNCQWALSPTKDDVVNLLKMPSYGAMPPWMTGSNYDLLQLDTRHISDDFRNVRNSLTLCNLLLDFLTYFTSHYCGAMFEASLTNPLMCYDSAMAQFLAPCSQILFDSIVDLIHYFLDMIKNKSKRSDWSSEQIEFALRTLISLLQYNLSNTKKRHTETIPNGQTIDNIIELMKLILQEDSLYFLINNAAFLILTSFDVLFTERLAQCPSIYYLIISRVEREDYLYYALQTINYANLLPYCISLGTCREIIEPIFEHMVTKPLELQANQLEFVSMFQSSLMVEMRKIYIEYPTELPEAQAQLQQTFFMYSRIITERMITFIQIPDNEILAKYIKYSTFFRLFRKWLMLLQPLAKFSRVSQTLITYLSSLFKPFQKVVYRYSNGLLTKNGNNFSYMSKIFNELFSIYIDFISSLLNGGEELHEATQYLWLVRSTLEAKINPEILDAMTTTVLSDNTPSKERKKLLSRGISFNTSDTSLEPKMILGMIALAVLPKESEPVRILFDYLYTKVKAKLMSKKLNDKDRHLERLLFMAFMKQLGFGSEVLDLNQKLMAKEEAPVLSHFIRMTVECVYRSRREIRAARQNAIMSSNMQSYDDYISNIQKKCIFLIYIQPCLRYQQVDIDTAFPEYLKKIQAFILGKIEIDKCFKLIEAAENARKHISTGLKLVNDILKSDINTELTTFMLDRLAASESIMKYLSSLHFTSITNTNENTGFNNVLVLLDNLSKMISEIPDDSITNTLIIFYSNLVFTIGKMSQEAIFAPMQNILYKLNNKKILFSPQHYRAYIALISSCLYALLSESPQLTECPQFKDLQKVLFQDNTLYESQLSVTRLCLSAGMDLPYTAETVISFIKSCSPILYHPAFSLLLEVIRRSQQKKKIFKFILKEIAQICSGGLSSFMKDTPTLIEANPQTNVVRTPEILLGACSEMIQICRRCLAVDNECRTILLSILSYILSKSENNENIKYSVSQGQKGTSSSIDDLNDYQVFQTPIFLFAVFAILSNVIDTFRNYSMIKDMSNNTIYYIKEIDQKMSQYIGWQLPISGHSIQRAIPFSSELAPISSMPFSPELFPDHSLLMPYFINALENRESSTRDEALDFYVLSSFLSYISDKTFLTRFMTEHPKFSINSITFDYSTKDFISILKMHLSENSVGFSMSQGSGSHLLPCSPAHTTSNKEHRSIGNEINCENGTHMYISSILSLKQPTYLEISRPFQTSFSVGVHCLSQNPSSSSTYLFNYNGIQSSQILLNSRIIKNITRNDKITSLTISFNPIKSKASFYDSSSMIKLHSLLLPSNKCCFILQIFEQKQFFDSSKIKYHISHLPVQSFSINSTNAQFLCPISGQTVFKRTRRKPTSLSNALNTKTIKSTPPAHFDSDIFTMSFVPMDEGPMVEFTSNLSSSQFVSYPSSVIKACGHSLNIKHSKEIAIPPTFTALKINKISNTSLSTPMPAFYEADSSNSPLVYKFENSEDAVTVNGNTGEVTSVEKESVKPVYRLEPLHPRNYPILPTEILNIFATGCIAKIRHEVINQIFLRAIATNPSEVESIVKSFNLDTLKLIEYSLYLMLFLEPLHFQLINEAISPVNFGFNILDRNQMASSTRYIHKASLNNIFSYFQTTSQIPNVIDLWFSYLEHQFSMPQSHFISQNHSSAVFSPLLSLSEPKHISIPGATSLIIFKTGFSRKAPHFVNVNYVVNQTIQTAKISNNVLLVNSDSITSIELVHYADGVSIVVLPVFSSNESLFGSFFFLGVSFKYFINYLVQNIDLIDNNKLHKIRVKLYQLYIDSFIAESPFFFYFGQDVLKFLRTSLPTSGSDFADDMPIKLSLLALYTKSHKFPFIGQFLEEQQMMWDERMLLPLKKYFPEFLTEADKREIVQVEDGPFGLPSPPLPQELPPSNDSSDCGQLGGKLKRLLKPRTSIEGYPFHLLLHLWAQYSTWYPPFETKILTQKIIEVTFLFYVPKSVVFDCAENPKPNIRYCHSIENSDNFENGLVNALDPSSDDKITVNGPVLYLEMTSDTSWENFAFSLYSKEEKPHDSFIQKYRDNFVSDITRLVLHWNISDDEKLLSCFPISDFSSPTISLTISPKFLLRSIFPLPIHLLCIRSTLLFALNWLLYYDKISFESDPSLKCLCQSMSMSLRTSRFRQLIDLQSNDETNEIQINRREAYEVRSGTSDNIQMTIIAQLTRCYKDPHHFRRRGDKPWRVNLIGESGIDAGGPARELVSEAATDLISPNCGLFIPVPNARNDVGNNREFVIPISDPRITNALSQYKFAGVLIGICIRSSIVQDLNIAPLVWEYLAGSGLSIENIFEIDTNYQTLISSLIEASRSDMDETTFQAKFNLRFVIYDSRGQEVPLTQRGRLEKVTLANVSEFISLANEYRLGEMRQNLEAMRVGLWENLNFKPPAFITGEMIEFSACGNKEITFEAMKKIIRFEVSSEQQEYFLRALQSMTSEQRSALLKFATGRVRLPTQAHDDLYIKVDVANGQRDRLPTSSTCFNQFHMPQYSSYEKAFQMIIVAIEYTGTFENR